MQWRVAFMALAIVGAAAGAQAGENAGPFLGPWTIAEAKPVPGTAPTGPPNANLLNATVSIGRTRLEGPAPFSCARAMYWSEQRGPAYLFSSSLPDAERQAKELGFGAKITILSVGCKSGDAQYPDIALADEHTAMFALDNYIYVMKR